MVVFENLSSNVDSCPALNCLLQFSEVLLWHLSHSKGKRGVELQEFLLFPSTEPEESCCAQGSRKGKGAWVPSCSHSLRCSSASKARPDQLMETGSSCSYPSVFPPLNYHWFLSKACNSTTILGSYLRFCGFFLINIIKDSNSMAHYFFTALILEELAVLHLEKIQLLVCCLFSCIFRNG